MAFVLIVATILVVTFLYKLQKDYSILGMARRIKTVNGDDIEKVAPTAPGSSIFGNNLDLVSLNMEEMFAYRTNLITKMGKSFVQYFLAMPIYNVVTAEDAELIFADNRLITKGIAYRFLYPFINTGLLTSTGQKWHSRRKMLTPAFHFNILEQFLEIFKEESQRFITNLKKSDRDVISLTEIVPRLTLNGICETALGVCLDDMKDGDLYRSNLDDIERALAERFSNPLFASNFLWEHFGNAKKYRASHDGVHKFSSDIIKKRRAMFENLEKAKKNNDKIVEDDNIFMSKKKRYAMLDSLLINEKEGLIDHDGICEEVDTFIFEGFDTTSMGLIYGIMNLGVYPEIQQRCFEEVNSLIDDDLSTLTITQINKLEYLDRFVKETMRMYPSVPVISREAEQETALANNVLLPKGAQITLHIYEMLRDPRHFKDPNVFEPDRFLPENMKGRHPYAYVPFSAGSRNCVGQKFAMLEMKTVLINVIKNFKVFKVSNPEDFKYQMGFLLRVTQSVNVRIEKRT